MQYSEMKALLMMVTSPVEKLELVMDFASQLSPVPGGAQCSEIFGCTSRVEICRAENNFYASADSVLVRGIVAIIIAMVQGRSADEIKKMDLKSEFSSLGINLGTGRLAGVNSMISFLQNL